MTFDAAAGKGKSRRGTKWIVCSLLALVVFSVTLNLTATLSHTSHPCIESSNPPQQQKQQQQQQDLSPAQRRASLTGGDRGTVNHNDIELPLRPVWARWQESTIIATLSFGNATKTRLAERLIWSLKTNGDWNNGGRIVVITDNPTHYQATLKQWKNVHIIAAKQEDLYPKDIDSSSKLLEFKREPMRFKRFKTLLLDYCEQQQQQQQQLAEYNHNNIQNYEHLLYMDVDIVVTRSIPTFLQDYQDQMIRREVFQSAHTLAGNQTTKPFLSMFTDCATCAKRNTNSGVILMHRRHSKACLLEWKRLFDTGASWAVYDQRHLREIHNVCKIYKLPDSHRLYPTWKEMRTKVSATFVHNTNSYNALKIPARVQREYFEYLLNTTAFSEIEHF